LSPPQRIFSKCEQFFKSAMNENPYLDSILTDCKQWITQNIIISHLTDDHILALVLLTYKNNNISIWNQVNNALETNNTIWKKKIFGSC